MAIIPFSTVPAGLDLNTEDLVTTPADYDASYEAYEVTITAGDVSQTLNVRGARLVVAVCEGAAKWYIANIDDTLNREFALVGEASHPTASTAGIITRDVMPDYLLLKDTSSSSNETTIYVWR